MRSINTRVLVCALIGALASYRPLLIPLIRRQPHRPLR
jgi:hypothetical protein